MTLSNPFTHDARVLNEAKALLEQDHEVTVLAWDRNKENKKEEERDGIKIVRFQNTRFMDLLQYDIFRLRYWWKNGYKLALELHKEQKFDVIHSHDFDTLPIGVKLKKKVGIPLIYDAHEIWGYMIKNEIPWWRYYLWKEKRNLKYTDHIITVAEPHMKYFENKGYSDVTIVTNCKEKITEKYIPPQNDVFTLIYIGGFNGKRFTPKAIEVCRDIEGIKLKVAGFGSNEDKIKDLIKNTSQEKVEFLGRIDVERVIPETLEADAVLCMFDPNFMNNRIGPPNKLFEAMVCGRPVIATKNIYSGKLVEKLNMGLAIDYEKESFKDALIKLRDNPDLRKKLGKNALKAALLRYNWEEEEKRLLEVYEKVLQ